jgi:hypothetical protein
VNDDKTLLLEGLQRRPSGLSADAVLVRKLWLRWQQGTGTVGSVFDLFPEIIRNLLESRHRLRHACPYLPVGQAYMADLAV